MSYELWINYHPLSTVHSPLSTISYPLNDKVYKGLAIKVEREF
jgi:hypothetical protein